MNQTRNLRVETNGFYFRCFNTGVDSQLPTLLSQMPFDHNFAQLLKMSPRELWFVNDNRRRRHLNKGSLKAKDYLYDSDFGLDALSSQGEERQREKIFTDSFPTLSSVEIDLERLKQNMVYMSRP